MLAERVVRTTIAGCLWFTAFATAAYGLPHLPMLGVAVAVLLLSLPAMLALWHHGAVRSTLALHAYRPGAFLHRWLGRRVLGMVVGAVAALFITALALIQTPFLDATDWVLLLAAGLVFAVWEALVHRCLQAQYANAWYAHRALRRWVHGGAVLLLGGVWVALRAWGAPHAPDLLGEQVATLQSTWATAPSHALRWAWDALAWGHASSAWALESLNGSRWWQGLLTLLISPITLFGYAALAISGAALPPAERHRAVATTTTNNNTQTDATSRWTVAQAVMWGAVGVLGIWTWLYAAAHLEYSARSTPSAFAVTAMPQCERIGGQVYALGTSALLLQMHQQTSAPLAAVSAQACPQLTSVRAMAEAGVDAYLDWYFSLGAEWLRVLTMLTGDADLLLRAKFEQLVFKNADVAPALDALQQAQNVHNATTINAFASAKAMLESQRLVINADQCRPAINVANSPLMLDLEARSLGVATRSGTALTAGTVAGVIAAKAMGKASMKVASKVLLKVAGKKLLGKFASAPAGAVIGSAIPGAGTAIGAGVGALLGLAFGTGVDVALLAAEEKLHRATMRAELLEAVDESLASPRDMFGCAAPGSQTTPSAPTPAPGPPP